MQRTSAVFIAKLLLVAGILLSGVGFACAGERRLALVVGAADYKNVPRLENALSDARAVAAALQRVGFEVVTVLDPDRAALETAVRQLGQRAQGADAALFFYAGHALEVGGRNWLLPVSADIQSALDLRFEAMDLESVLEQLATGARFSLMFIDACRDNPFRNKLGAGQRALATRGLARMEAAVGTLIAFATGPGRVAADGTSGNSPFSTSLLRHIEKPGLEIRKLMGLVRGEVRKATNGRQIPWENSALEGDFFFKPAPKQGQAQPAGGQPTRNLDALFWDSVRNSTNASDMRAYLARFPNGVFAELARSRLARLEQPSTPRQATPPVSANTPVPPPAPDAAAAPAEGSALSRALTARFAALLPTLEPQRQAELARRYEEAKGHKAQAVSLDPMGLWRRSGWGDPAEAVEHALEGCQLRYGNPCALLARDDVVLPDGSDGKPPVRDMQRIGYAGHFDVQRIPIVNTKTRSRADLMGFAAVTGPKAIALHPWGGVFVVAAAQTQRAAEAEALKSCNDDPVRRGRDGPCYLYAAGNRVVLSHRLTGPRPPTKTIAEAMTLIGMKRTAENYARERPHKALALEPYSGRPFRWPKAASSKLAEEYALEGCQLSFALPCTLVASDEELRAPDPLSAKPHDMARLRYSGPFRASMVPFVTRSRREAVKGYPQLPSPRAMAIRAIGARITTATGTSIADAEAKALALCNDADAVHPCFLYAVNDRVVLPQRRTEARQ